MAKMFGRQAWELLQEVAQCPAESQPPFNVRRPCNLWQQCQSSGMG